MELKLALDQGAVLPGRATAQSFGYDLVTLQHESIASGATQIITTGLRLAENMPTTPSSGVAMLIVPRSSLWKKFGLIIPNTPGLIDADYTGPIGIQVWRPLTFSDLFTKEGQFVPQTPLLIPAGTRLAQAVFVSLLTPTVVAAPFEEREVRDGFGSTGHGTGTA